jgi:hypothetical protein
MTLNASRHGTSLVDLLDWVLDRAIDVNAWRRASPPGSI